MLDVAPSATRSICSNKGQKLTLTLILGLATFTFVASITPGPNNMMLMASGANFGLRRTVPHMAGVSLGFGVMVLVVGFALAGIIAALPWLYEVLRWAGAAYLLYLAYKIATSHGIGTKTAPQSPMTFWQAAAFQWVNPKALAMCVGAVTTYAARDHLYLNVALVALAVTVIGAPCITSWAAFGVGMKRVLNRPATMRAFNIGMALLLVLSLYPMLTERLGR
jgi:threonine/homoserine/homoserine lactone efflux protein